MIYYYERKRQNRAMCYLVSEKDVNAFIEELNKIQNAQKVFFNVGVKPYKGKRYSAPLFEVRKARTEEQIDEH